MRKNFTEPLLCFALTVCMLCGAMPAHADSAAEAEFNILSTPIEAAETEQANAAALAVELPADVQNHPQCHVINTLLQNGIVGLYSDGRFRPDRSISREEAAYFFGGLLRRLLPDKNTWDHAQRIAFNDVAPTRWSAENIGLVAELGFIPPEGSFRPEAAMTRAELAEMLYAYMRTLPDFDNVSFYFPDVSAENHSAGYLRAHEVMYGRPDGAFHPSEEVSRAEACYALYTLSGLELIYAADNLPRRNIIYSPYVSQLSPVYAVVGCEGASLLMGLKAKGYASGVGLREFLDNMPKHSSNPAKGYVGSPYSAKQTSLRTTIYPAPLAEYGRRYGKVTDISGASPREFQAEILGGNPVVAYATMYWKNARYVNYNIEGEIQSLLRNNHVILVDGYDRDTGMYHISDPYNQYNTNAEYRYWIDGATFESSYNIRRHAVVIE